MNLALKSSLRISQKPAILSRNLHPLSGSRAPSVCFSGTSHAESPEMDTTKELPEGAANHENNIMSHSFGEGYSTRSDEEGFGGTYCRNDDGDGAVGMKKKTDHVHENHPGYDKKQGSEVKEKEKGRHQTN